MVDYATQLYAMISGVGDAYAEGRGQRQSEINQDRNYATELERIAYNKQRDATKDSQWEQSFDANQAYRGDSLGLDRARLDLERQRLARGERPNIETFYDASGRETKGIYDPSAPNGFRPVGGAKPLSNGMVIETLPDGTTRVVQGGGGKVMPAEIGARIGLGNQFLDTDLPKIRKEIGKGTLGGGGLSNPLGNLGASIQMAAGVGAPGEINRRVQTGLDALRRNLTGQGMSVSEADDYISRYVPGAADSMDTINSKLNGLEADLRAVSSGATAGRIAPAGGMPVAPAAQGVTDSRNAMPSPGDIEAEMRRRGLSR